jgi:hypothetical protein
MVPLATGHDSGLGALLLSGAAVLGGAMLPVILTLDAPKHYELARNRFRVIAWFINAGLLFGWCGLGFAPLMGQGWSVLHESDLCARYFA